MYRSILLTNENSVGDGYSVEWDGLSAVIMHDVEADYIVGVLNDDGAIVTIPYTAESGRLTLTFAALCRTRTSTASTSSASMRTSRSPSTSSGTTIPARWTTS